MQTLVTGATGFLGRHLVPLLAERDGDLRALVREGTDASALEPFDVEVVRGGIGDVSALRRAADGCGLIFHLAGIVSHEHRDEQRLVQANVEGVRALLGAADPAARIVHVSSVATFGPVEAPGQAADESHLFPPGAERLVYARTKRAGERLALEAAAAGRDVVVANPGFLIGPGDVYRVSTWLVWRYLQGTLRVYVDGGLSFVDARDVAEGLVTLADRGRAGDRTILTSREGNLALRDFFRRVAQVTGRRRRMTRVPARAAALGARLMPWPAKPGEVEAVARWWFFDPAKAERELGFTTRPLDETIAATAAQYL
jgi:nucleoside-diphosphate-sugar epimerase